jgi:hypothetical protein
MQLPFYSLQEWQGGDSVVSGSALAVECSTSRAALDVALGELNSCSDWFAGLAPRPVDLQPCFG